MRFGGRNVDLYAVERAPYPVYHREMENGNEKMEMGMETKAAPRSMNRGEICSSIREWSREKMTR